MICLGYQQVFFGHVSPTMRVLSSSNPSLNDPKETLVECMKNLFILLAVPTLGVIFDMIGGTELPVHLHRVLQNPVFEVIISF